MKRTIILTTPRLILRLWQPEDIEPYYQINQDPEVVYYLLGPQSRTQVEQFVAHATAEFAVDKFCKFAVEEKATGLLIGFVGISRPTFTAPFTPAIDIGWRLGSTFWGKGYATEAALAVVNYAFTVLKIDEIVSFAVASNVRSLRVMEKIGMVRDINGDFMHPRIPVGHEFARHVLYRLKRPV